jgi:hypothetical protein
MDEHVLQVAKVEVKPVVGVEVVRESAIGSHPALLARKPAD